MDRKLNTYSQRCLWLHSLSISVRKHSIYMLVYSTSPFSNYLSGWQICLFLFLGWVWGYTWLWRWLLHRLSKCQSFSGLQSPRWSFSIKGYTVFACLRSRDKSIAKPCFKGFSVPYLHHKYYTHNRSYLRTSKISMVKWLF